VGSTERPLGPPVIAAEILDSVVAIAREASDAVLELYGTSIEVYIKDDRSPVTAADHAAEAAIIPALERLCPGIPVISEERFAAGEDFRPESRFWLVDPLDGTKEFIARSGDFTVNIALIEDGVPTLGVVAAPARSKVYAGQKDGGGFIEDAAGRRSIRCRRAPSSGIVLASSRSHGDPEALTGFLAGRTVSRSLMIGSSLKFCLVAGGEADLYPRLGRTMEWDTAAGHAILAAAGGDVVTLDDDPLLYGKPGFENPHFVARGLTSSR